MPPSPDATASLAPGPPPFGLEWRRQHLGKGHLLLAATPGLDGQMPAAEDGAVAFATWDDDNEPWGPWAGNGTLWLPAVRPSQEGTYLATIHLPYLQGQVTLELAVQSELGSPWVEDGHWGYGDTMIGGGIVEKRMQGEWGGGRLGSLEIRGAMSGGSLGI